MHPITYYVQDAAINRLVEFYGPHLEQATREEKMILLAGLIGQLVDPQNVDVSLNPEIDPGLRIHLDQLAYCKPDQKIALIGAISSLLGIPNLTRGMPDN